MYITTKETRRIQNETKQQIKDEREEDRKRNRKRFADEISQIVAKYITDISKYFYSNRALERLDNDRCRILQELNNTQHEIDRQYKKKKSLNIEVAFCYTDACRSRPERTPIPLAPAHKPPNSLG